MAKSVNDYYLEKMNKLLEMQNQQEASSSPKPLYAPQRRPQTARSEEKEAGGRDYYDRFREKTKEENKPRSPQKPRERAAYTPPSVRTETKRGTASSAGIYSKPRRQVGGAAVDYERNKKRTVNPQQTQVDKERERETKEQAIQKAKRAKKLRNLRDGFISFVLILAVFSVMCVVVYRLLFVVSDIKITGNSIYTTEEIGAASGVTEGEHLYSFRASLTEKSVMLNCPQVMSVEVNRVAPKTVNLTVTEEEREFYCDFFGEYRAMSASLRVLNSTTLETATEQGLVKLRLPAARKAVAGENVVYSNLKSDGYIYEFCSILQESALWDTVTAIDLTNKKDVKFVCKDSFLISVGSTADLSTKLKIGEEILRDPMFQENIKAKIDLKDLSASSVAPVDKLDINW